jgi:hypothetical protein
MPILPQADFNQLIDWLNQNLLTANSFVPHLDSITNINSKGIYFWFMRPDGYKALSNYVTIEPIEPKYTRNIDGVIYDLVYLGTAGTGKKGNSNITERFVWHINQNHNASNICHGTLSTLRAGVGALLSNDLIDTDTENDVNDFMKQYMKVFWIEYPNDIELIDNEEIILIQVIKPLFNLDYNSNSYVAAIDNPTKSYKKRRNKIYKKTKERIGCKVEEGKKMKKQNSTEFAVFYEERIVTDDKLCVEYTVLQSEDIGKVTKSIKELPVGKVIVKIFDSKNPEKTFDLWTFRDTGNNNNPDAQNIFKYFSRTAPDKLKEKSKQNNFSNNRANWIKWWMFDNEIEKITIRVCPIN